MIQENGFRRPREKGRTFPAWRLFGMSWAVGSFKPETLRCVLMSCEARTSYLLLQTAPPNLSPPPLRSGGQQWPFISGRCRGGSMGRAQRGGFLVSPRLKQVSAAGDGGGAWLVPGWGVGASAGMASL